MRTILNWFSSKTPKRSRSFLRRWGKDTEGATAIEFALVSLPFLMFVGGIIGYGHYIFTSNGLEFAVEQAARKVRTGQAQTAGMTREDFRNLVCAQGFGIIDCNASKLKIHLQSAATWSGISPISCLSGGSLGNSGGASTDAIKDVAGEASQSVLITACYEWTLAQTFPYLMLGNMGNGSSVIQAVAAFKSEPYK
jgi:Flp pilus assembly pilin Flp